MKVAIPIHPETGRIYGSYSNAAHFIYYTLDEGKIVERVAVTLAEQGVKRAVRLSSDQVQLLICNKIEAKAIRALNTFQVQVIPSVTGSADEAATECALDFSGQSQSPCSGNCSTCKSCIYE